jgi:hypothetical protein
MGRKIKMGRGYVRSTQKVIILSTLRDRSIDLDVIEFVSETKSTVVQKSTVVMNSYRGHDVHELSRVLVKG